MSTQESLEAAIRREPSDRTAVACYADWRQEYLAEGRFIALRRAALVARAEQIAREVALSQSLLTRSWWSRALILQEIGFSLDISPRQFSEVIVVPGRRLPAIGIWFTEVTPQIRYGLVVTVGARWAIRVVTNESPGTVEWHRILLAKEHEAQSRVHRRASRRAKQSPKRNPTRE